MGLNLFTGGWAGSTFLWAATEPAGDVGVDLQGIALVISAIAALVTSVGGILIAYRRSSTDSIDKALAELLARREDDDRDP